MSKNKAPAVVTYQNEYSDDFAGTKINKKLLGKKFKYVNRNPFFRFSAFLVYYLIAVPLFWVILKVKYGFRIKNKRNLKKVKGTGYFLYANHTALLDVGVHYLVNWPRRSYVLADRDAVSIKGVKTLVMMLGCLPLPDTPSNNRQFLDAIEYRARYQKRAVNVYPEAHIWKYYNKIRPLRDGALRYPAQLDLPVVVATTVWRKPKFPFKKPRMTIVVSEPLRADFGLDIKQKSHYLCFNTQKIMEDMVHINQSFEYIKYQKVEH